MKCRPAALIWLNSGAARPRSTSAGKLRPGRSPARAFGFDAVRGLAARSLPQGRFKLTPPPSRLIHGRCPRVSALSGVARGAPAGDAQEQLLDLPRGVYVPLRAGEFQRLNEQMAEPLLVTVSHRVPRLHGTLPLASEAPISGAA